MISIDIIHTLHADSLVKWYDTGLFYKESGFYATVIENHAFNFQLWNQEDEARRDDLGFEHVYRAKRAIDGFNQERNNRMEQMDDWITYHLKPSTQPTCPIHSETPGMMIDRLSILSLKQYHMTKQTKRQDVDDAHRLRCQDKLSILTQQQQTLLHCLNDLLSDIETQKRTFRTYRQCKMYNDPTLNPALYTKDASKC